MIKVFPKTIERFIFIDSEYVYGVTIGNCTINDIKDRFQIKGRLYLKRKYNCGGKTYKLIDSDYEFTLFPIN